MFGPVTPLPLPFVAELCLSADCLGMFVHCMCTACICSKSHQARETHPAHPFTATVNSTPATSEHPMPERSPTYTVLSWPLYVWCCIPSDLRGKLLQCVSTVHILRMRMPGYSPKITCHLSDSTAKQQSPQDNNETAFKLVPQCPYEQTTNSSMSAGIDMCILRTKHKRQ